jgi:hypothetical protein
MGYAQGEMLRNMERISGVVVAAEFLEGEWRSVSKDTLWSLLTLLTLFQLEDSNISTAHSAENGQE